MIWRLPGSALRSGRRDHARDVPAAPAARWCRAWARTFRTIWNPSSKFFIGARWVLFKSGLGATNHFESTGFIRTHAGRKYPNVQFHFLPLNIRYDAKGGAEIPGYQIHSGVNNPYSRGWVRARSPNPQDYPELQVNYMSDPRDVEEYRMAFKLTREICSQPAFDPCRKREIDPGEGVQSGERSTPGCESASRLPITRPAVAGWRC